VPPFWFSPSISELIDSVAILEVGFARETRAPRIGSWQLPDLKKISKVSEHFQKNKFSLSVQALGGRRVICPTNFGRKLPFFQQTIPFFQQTNWN